MDEHFSAFSFVDRITDLQPGAAIRGSYSIPAGLDHFHESLVAEAVGQLAAWAAMAAVDFKRRPVAGIAGSIQLLGKVRPGQELQLAADIDSVDEEAVSYHGTAHANGAQVIRLQDCVGPMIPLEEFDDPKALRDRFGVLRGAGGERNRFGGVPALELKPLGGEKGQSLRAGLQVPASAPFFADHFPRRPVFPGSLLMHSNLELAARLAAELPAPSGGAWALDLISDVKLRTFIPPGESLELEARLNGGKDTPPNSATVAVETRNGKRVVGSARVLLASRARS